MTLHFNLSNTFFEAGLKFNGKDFSKKFALIILAYGELKLNVNFIFNFYFYFVHFSPVSLFCIVNVHILFILPIYFIFNLNTYYNFRSELVWNCIIAECPSLYFGKRKIKQLTLFRTFALNLGSWNSLKICQKSFLNM